MTKKIIIILILVTFLTCSCNTTNKTISKVSTVTDSMCSINYSSNTSKFKLTNSSNINLPLNNSNGLSFDFNTSDGNDIFQSLNGTWTIGEKFSICSDTFIFPDKSDKLIISNKNVKFEGNTYNNSDFMFGVYNKSNDINKGWNNYPSIYLSINQNNGRKADSFNLLNLVVYDGNFYIGIDYSYYKMIKMS